MKPYTCRPRPLSLVTAITAILLCACTPADNSPAKASAAPSSFSGLRVTNWGPNATRVGVIPNKQPNGYMGLWIQVESTKGMGEVQVLVGEQVGSTAVVEETLITSAFPVEMLSQPGARDVTVKQVATGKSFSVGTLTISP